MRKKKFTNIEKCQTESRNNANRKCKQITRNDCKYVHFSLCAISLPLSLLFFTFKLNDKNVYFHGVHQTGADFNRISIFQPPAENESE